MTTSASPGALTCGPGCSDSWPDTSGRYSSALAQRAEARSTYDTDVDATPTMAADERIHLEVVRALATRGRNQLSGSFRAAVFGANDGLVSNLALVLGISATGVTSHTVLATGLAGLLAGALSMGAGEYVSVNSQRELLEASTPSPEAGAALPQLDVNVKRAGIGLPGARHECGRRNETRRQGAGQPCDGRPRPTRRARCRPARGRGHGSSRGGFQLQFLRVGGTDSRVALLFGLEGTIAVVVAAGLVGIALLATGIVVGLLSGGPPVRRALRQLMIGYGAATVTYVLGLLFGAGAG